MDHPLIDLISQQIKEAEARGEFDNLPGAGKPLPPASSGDPLLNRLAAEAAPASPIVVLRKDIQETRARLQRLTDPDARKSQMKILADLETRLGLEIEAAKRGR